MSDFAVNPKPKLNVETKSSSYDRLNAFLIASILLVGFLFTVLFLIWLTSVVDFSRAIEGPIVEEIGDPGDEKPKGEEDDVLEPGVEEFPEVEVPQLAASLEAVTDAVSSVRASLEKRSGSAQQMGRGRGMGSRTGGPGGGGDGVPEYKRWKISYECPDINVYAQQLSFFNIDLGVIYETKQDVLRIKDPNGAKSIVRTDRETINETKQIYFIHEKQRMKQWDLQLCQQAGADLNNAFTVQFYPNATRQIIRGVESAALKEAGRELREVQNTMLKVVPDGGGFRFTVTGFVYR